MNSLPGPSTPLDISFNEDALATLTAAFERFGDAFSIFSPATGSKICVFSHPDHVRHVFVDKNTNFNKGIGIDRVRILLGNGIMTSEGEVWRRQRKMIQPAFHRDVIATLFSDIRDANLRLRADWATRAHLGQEIDLTHELSDVTLKIVLKAIFGTDMDAMQSAGGDNPFLLLMQEPERNLQFAYKFRALSRLVSDCIARRQNRPAESDLLGMLIAARDRKSDAPMTEKQLVDEVLTLIVAGHETTASALNWLWYLLSAHPKIESQMHNEIDAWDESGADVSSVLQLTYTRQIIEETLRLYPPGWLLTRRTINADVIGGHPIDANTDIFVSPYLVHRHPDYWDQPETFDPSRFSPEQKAARSRFCYLPFALGPRACIGEHFAMVEMITHAALIARKFRLKYICDVPIEKECQVNLRPKSNIMMKLEERT
jgi:enediyne biosynthesis protein E7